MCVTALLSTACEDKLDIPQKGVVAYEDFYQTDDDAEAALAAAYDLFARNVARADKYIISPYEALFNLPGDDVYAAGEFYGDSKSYMEQIKRLDISDRVVMHTDFIPDHEVNRYFCAADLVAQPYKNATQSGVSQIAYHFEKPMVVTRVGGLPEIVPNEKAGFVVEPDAQHIADAIVRYFDEDWQERLTEGCRIEKQKYGWDKMTAAIASL